MADLLRLPENLSLVACVMGAYVARIALNFSETARNDMLQDNAESEEQYVEWLRVPLIEAERVKNLLTANQSMQDIFVPGQIIELSNWVASVCGVLMAKLPSQQM